MKKIEWQDDWYLGVDKIDNQHKELLSLVNRILKDDIKTKELVNDFIDYAAKHFRDEEKLMFHNVYPHKQYYIHKVEHQKFTRALLEISFALQENNDDSLPLKFRQFCIDWFRLHFLETDKLFTNFIKEVKPVDEK